MVRISRFLPRAVVAAALLATPPALAGTTSYSLLSGPITAGCMPDAGTGGLLSDCSTSDFSTFFDGTTSAAGSIEVDRGLVTGPGVIDATNLGAITSFMIDVTIAPAAGAGAPETVTLDGDVHLFDGARFLVTGSALGVDFSAAGDRARIEFRHRGGGVSGDSSLAFIPGTVMAEYNIATDSYFSIARRELSDASFATIAAPALLAQSTTPVPLPGGLPLLLSGAAVALLLRRRARTA